MRVVSQPGQLNLAITPQVGTMSTSKSWVVNRYATWSTSRVLMAWQCKLVCGWGLRE